MKRRAMTLTAALASATFMLAGCGGEKGITEDGVRDHMIDMQVYEGETKTVTPQEFCSIITPQYLDYGETAVERGEAQQNGDAKEDEVYENLTHQQEVLQEMENTVRGNQVEDEEFDALRQDVLDPSKNLIQAYQSVKNEDAPLSDVDTALSEWGEPIQTLVMTCNSMEA